MDENTEVIATEQESNSSQEVSEFAEIKAKIEEIKNDNETLRKENESLRAQLKNELLSRATTIKAETQKQPEMSVSDYFKEITKR